MIKSHFQPGDELIKALSMETYRWGEDGPFLIKTHYNMPEAVGSQDDPYEFLLKDRS
tara:strand:- start:521 stop:691 length:171 start_codon:yes stop_codon:yes gene_type:complete